MRSFALIVSSLVITIIIAGFTDVPDKLLAARAASIVAGDVRDLAGLFARLIAPATGPGTAAFLTGAALHLGVAVIISRSESRRPYRAALLHPAALLLTLGGYGGVSAALGFLFITLLRSEQADTPRAVPSLGLALLLAAAFMPRFDLLALAFLSPLILVAPRPMLREHVLSFYLVVGLPALTLLGLAALLLPAPPDAAGQSALGFAAMPAALLPVAGAFVFGLRDRWRATAALLAIGVGLLAAPFGGALWPVLAAGLAAGFALPMERAVSWHLVVGAFVAVAAVTASVHMPGL